MGLKEITKWQDLLGFTGEDLDGDFGPETLKRSLEVAAKTGLRPIIGRAPWLDIARGEIGQKEKQGGENPRIIEYHATCSLKAKEDEVPWCSAFVCWCLEQAGIKSTRSAWARSYEKYGKKLILPQDGCIVVFDWKDGTGHVGFVTGWTGGTVAVLGGNQSNEVNVTTYSRNQVSAWIWPVV